MKKLLSIRDTMTTKPVVVGPETTVDSAVKQMLKAKVGSLIVQENGMLKGIVTEKDLVEKIILKNLNSKKTKIKSIMNTTLFTISPDADILEAIKLMTKNNIRRLPVVDKNNSLLGLVTINDILRIQPQLFELVLDKSRLFASRKEYVDSQCDKCKVFSMVKLVDGRFLCKDCERSESVINYLK